MDDPIEFVNRSYQYENIQTDILTGLEKLRQQFPERFPKPIDVLAAVDDSVDGQWEHCLRLVKANRTGERVTLIPYHLVNSHWIGILLEFKDNEKMQRAEFIDPVNHSHFVPDKLQKRFATVYPDVILQLINLQKHDDPEQSAALTVQNLLKAAEEAQLTDVKYTGMNHSRNQIFNDYNTSNCLTEEEPNISISAAPDGNTSELRDLKQISNSELERLDVQDGSKLPVKVPQTELEVKQYEVLDKYNITEKGEELSDESGEFRKVPEQIYNVTPGASVCQKEVKSEPESYEILKQQLEDGFAKHDMSTKEELKQRIIEKKQKIQSLENEERHNLVRKQKDSLSELEQLQLLVDKIEAIKSSHPSVDYNQPEESLDIDYPNKDTAGQIKTTEMVETDMPMPEEYPIIEESLSNLQKDFCSMPSCSERSIICLMFYVSLKLVGTRIVLYPSIKVPDQIDTEIAREFECLKKRLEIEELESGKIQNSVDACLGSIKDKNWKTSLNILKRLLEQISPLDMRELFRLIKKADDAAQLIKNKDIILFIGATRSGKSTVIHFLAGSHMVETKLNGLSHIAPVKIKHPSLKNITTSPFARSKTRYITPVTVKYDDVSGYSNGSIILCDSPGFEDTSGAEVDIANGIGTAKAIKGCKSVKPVVLISYTSFGDRFRGLKNLTHFLVGLISGIEDEIKAFSYLFTKYPQNERSTINASLRNVIELLNADDKSNTSVTFFLKDMLLKTRNGARILDPIRDHPGEILDELAGSTAIDRPEEVFQFSITEKSKATVHEQVGKHQLSIMSASKRSDYLFIKYKLDQLKYLYDQLDQEYIKQVYNDCVRHISKHLSEEYQQGISTLNRCLMNQTVLSNVDIKQFQISIDHAQLAEELRNKHLGKEVVHTSAFIQYLHQQVDIILENLKKKAIDDVSVKISLDKIKLLSNSFPDMACKYKDACQFLAEKFDSVANSFKSSVLSNEFDNSATEITKLHEALITLQDHIDSENMQEKYIKLREYFLKYLNDCVDKFNQIFTQEKLEERDIDRLNSCSSMLETASNTFALYPHISKESINEIYEIFLSRILSYFEAIITEVHTQLNNEYSCHLLEPLIKEMTLIRTISSIESRTNRSYFSTLEKLCGCIQETRRDVEEILKAFFRPDEQIDYNKLTKCFSSLKKARWIEEYRLEVYLNVVDDVEKQINQHVDELQKSVMEINLDLDNYDKIEHVYKIVCEINKMKQVELIVTDIDQRIGAVNIWFEREINNVCVIIKNTFSLETWKEQGHPTLDLSKIEKAFHYLDACKKIRVSGKSDCMFVLNNLEEFIRYFSDFVQKEMESYFETVKQYENENKKDMFEKVRTLSTRLQEISEIKTKYSRVFSYFPNQEIIEHCQNELSQFLSSLKSGDINSVSKFLVEENKGAEDIWSSRTVCLMDATGSMSHNNISSGSFQIDFVESISENNNESNIPYTSQLPEKTQRTKQRIQEYVQQIPSQNELPTRVQWMWYPSPNPWLESQSVEWCPFPDVENMIIEEALTTTQTHAMLDNYHIDFKQELQISNSDTKKQRPIKRLVCNTNDKRLRKERFMSNPIAPNRPDACISLFFDEVIKDLKLTRQQMPSKDETTVPIVVEKAAFGIIEEGKKVGKQKEAEQMAKILMEKKGANMKEVWECCAHLYSLESFLYNKLNDIIRLIGYKEHEQVWRSTVHTLGPFCLLLWDYSLNNKSTTPETILYRGAEVSYSLITSLKYDCSKNHKPQHSLQAFTSCTRNSSVAEQYGNVLFIMEKYVGVSVDLQPFSNYPYEEEELILYDASFTVKTVEFDKDKNKYLIYLNLQEKHDETINDQNTKPQYTTSQNQIDSVCSRTENELDFVSNSNHDVIFHILNMNAQESTNENLVINQSIDQFVAHEPHDMDPSCVKGPTEEFIKLYTCSSVNDESINGRLVNDFTFSTNATPCSAPIVMSETMTAFDLIAIHQDGCNADSHSSPQAVSVCLSQSLELESASAKSMLDRMNALLIQLQKNPSLVDNSNDLYKNRQSSSQFKCQMTNNSVVIESTPDCCSELIGLTLMHEDSQSNDRGICESIETLEFKRNISILIASLDLKSSFMTITKSLGYETQMFEDICVCISHLLSTKNTLIYFTVSATMGELVIPLVHDHICVKYIYIHHDSDCNPDLNWTKAYGKIRGVWSSDAQIKEHMIRDIESFMTTRPTQWARSREIFTELWRQSLNKSVPTSELFLEEMTTAHVVLPKIVTLFCNGYRPFHLFHKNTNINKFNDIQQCADFIQENSKKSTMFLIICIIVNDSYGKVRALMELDCVHASYIFTENNALKQFWTMSVNKSNKLSGVFIHYKQLLLQLANDISFYREIPSHIPKMTVLKADPSRIDLLGEQEIDFIRFQLSANGLQNLSPERWVCNDIDQSSSFFYYLMNSTHLAQMINEIFSQKDVCVLLETSSPLRHIDQWLASLMVNDYPSPMTIYRAQLVSKEYLHMIQQNLNSLFTIHTILLFSRSFSSVTDICHRATDNGLIVILFEMNVSETTSLAQIDGDIFGFRLGSVFRILSINQASDGICHVRLELVDCAMKHIKEQLQFNIDDSNIWLTLGNFLTSVQQFKEAKTFYEYLLSNISIDNSIRASVYNNIGLLCSRMDNEEEALNYFDMALQAFVKDVSVQTKENRPQLLENQFISDPEFDLPTLYSKIAEEYHRQKDNTKAIDYYRKALEVAPDSATRLSIKQRLKFLVS